MSQSTSINRSPRIWRLLMRLVNPLMKAVLRSPLHPVVSPKYLLITVTGKRSGRRYSTPVQYALRGDKLYVITSQGYNWWKNLKGGAGVELRLKGKDHQGYAEISTEPTAVDTLFQTIYPTLDAAQRSAFTPGKVAVTIQLGDRQ